MARPNNPSLATQPERRTSPRATASSPSARNRASLPQRLRPYAATTAKLIAVLLIAVTVALGVNSAPANADVASTSGIGSSALGTVDVAAVEQPEPDAPGPEGPSGPAGPAESGDDTVNIDIGGLTDRPSTPVVTILLLTLLSVAPAILLTCTSFTKILVVLSLTRNALGLQQTPPNQVLVGLALFLSLFIMAPVLQEVYDLGLQPFLSGDKPVAAAFDDGSAPLRDFMVAHTDDNELRLLTSVADRELPANPDEVSLATLIPAFILTELKQAFIIGFIIFVPFLVIDIVVSGALMALGMMMMPPAIISLPFKLLLFVLVDGWALIMKALVASYA